MITVERWIDLDGPEWNKLPDPKGGKRFIERALACKALIADSDGRLFSNPMDGSKGIPLNDNLDGKVVGIRYPKFAAN